MRTNETAALYKFDGYCDVKDSPEVVLEMVDHLLKKFNLEVEVAETGDTTTLFRIIKVTKGSKK